MKPYEEVCFPSGILRWIREGDEYVCRLTEDQINEIKEIHEEPWVKTYSGGKPNYTQPDETIAHWSDSLTSKPEFIAEQKAMNEALRKRVMDGIPDMPIKVQDEREENYKSFAQSAQVLGAQYDPRRSPSGSWVSWENTMCNPLANARMQTQSAWQDGYNSAKAELAGTEPVAWGVDEGEGRCISLHDLYFVKEDADHMAELKGTHAKVVALYTAPPKKEWVGLSDEEIDATVKSCNTTDTYKYFRAIEAKLKEKNT
jgi:hypothetical protein